MWKVCLFFASAAAMTGLLFFPLAGGVSADDETPHEGASAATIGAGNEHDFRRSTGRYSGYEHDTWRRRGFHHERGERHFENEFFFGWYYDFGPWPYGYYVRAPYARISKVVVQTNKTTGANSVEVFVKERNFTIAGAGGKGTIDGGFIGYYLDVRPPTAHSRRAVPSHGTWVISRSSSFTFSKVNPGKHKIYVELLTSDATPLDPPVLVKQRVVVGTSS